MSDAKLHEANRAAHRAAKAAQLYRNVEGKRSVYCFLDLCEALDAYAAAERRAWPETPGGEERE
jgi:hypothetical protein